MELIQMIRIGLFGYGNIAKGVECAVTGNPDMQVTSVFTRRDPSTVKVMTEGVSVYHVDDVLNHKYALDLFINKVCIWTIAKCTIFNFCAF